MTGQSVIVVHIGSISILLKNELLKASKEGDGAFMLIDVGGGRGHEVDAIKKRHPNLPGRFLLQDLPDMIAQALPVPGMEAVAHNFLTTQPIKGQ